MNLRPRLTYGNVVATLALVLALGGGTVYAASQLGKNSVKSKQIAKGAVKTSDLAKNSVKSPKVKNGSIKLGDLAPGLIRADVTSSADAGPQGGLNANTTNPLPLRGTTTFTPQPGEVAAIAAEARFTFASIDPAQFCQPSVQVLVDGSPTRVFVSPNTENGNSTTPITAIGSDADGPFGLIAPGEPLAITATLRGDEHCTANSQLDRLEVRVLKFK